MGKTEMLFAIIFVLTILTGTAFFAINSFAVAEVPTEKTETANEEQIPVLTTEIIIDQATAQTSNSEVVEYDPELEMQYIYLQSQNIGSNFAELNEIQERMYDIAEDYDEVEYDMLQEQIDNERTIAKSLRLFEE